MLRTLLIRPKLGYGDSKRDLSWDMEKSDHPILLEMD